MNAVARFAPRPLVDRIILGQMRKNLNDRSFDDPTSPVADFAQRLTLGSG